MPNFKYTVANKEGKKLSGTVSAPDEQTAKQELNNLGFSVITLTVSEEPAPASGVGKFVFEGIDKTSKLITGTIASPDQESALKKLQTEYGLNVSAIWAEGASPEQIEQARQVGMAQMNETMQKSLENNQQEQIANEKKRQIVKTQIEIILKEVNQILENFGGDLDPEVQNNINKRINKLLRIKNSTNLDYILTTAKDLLKYIQGQEKELKEKGLQDKRLQLTIQTKKLINELNEGTKTRKSFTDDILEKLESLSRFKSVGKSGGKLIDRIKDYLRTPPEILVMKNQIKVYNRQLWEFIKLYFKEPTPEYKERVKSSLRAVWNARKKAKSTLRHLKKIMRQQRKLTKSENSTNSSSAVFQELTALTGWLLAFYIIYYFASLYLNTKYFGLSDIPAGFKIYESTIFKHALVIVFLLHATSALKINFFPKSRLATVILPTTFLFSSLIVILNF